MGNKRNIDGFTTNTRRYAMRVVRLPRNRIPKGRERQMPDAPLRPGESRFYLFSWGGFRIHPRMGGEHKTRACRFIYFSGDVVSSV